MTVSKTQCSGHGAKHNTSRSGDNSYIVCVLHEKRRHLVQLALTKNARRRQPVENASEAHAHEYVVSARASKLKENTVVRERRRREREKFGKIECFHSKKHPKSATKCAP